MELILASTSPRRRELLERIGIRDFKVVAPRVDEVVDDHLPPAEIVMSLAAQKAHAVGQHAPAHAIVIAADTIVALDGAVLGKPRDEVDAFQILSALSGNRHHVYTGVALLQDGHMVTQYEATSVTFRDLTPEEIDDYISTGEPMDKAGAYGIQGYGALFVQEISGDYPNVMGLPVARLARMLQDFGINAMKLAAKR